MTRKKKQPQSRIPIKDSNLELRIVQQGTREWVAFDLGLLFTKDTTNVEIYLDDLLKESIEQLLQTHKQLILKVNVFSPDVVMVVPSE